MNYYTQTGKMAIGSPLCLLSDKTTADAADIYKLYSIDLLPKWFPVFHTLTYGNFTITEIAQQIGHSHPSVSKMVAEMLQSGLIAEKKDKEDGRKNVITLSKKSGKPLKNGNFFSTAKVFFNTSRNKRSYVKAKK